jgi:hypothetical protein
MFQKTFQHIFDELRKSTRSSQEDVALYTLNCDIRGCIQKFSDWPRGARTANGTAACH